MGMARSITRQPKSRAMSINESRVTPGKIAQQRKYQIELYFDAQGQKMQKFLEFGLRIEISRFRRQHEIGDESRASGHVFAARLVCPVVQHKRARRQTRA